MTILKLKEQSEVFTSKQALDLLSQRMPIPVGWYVHGRNLDKKFMNDDYPTQFTRDMETALQYGRHGSVWIAKPTHDAKVLNFSSTHTNDMNKFVSIIQKAVEKEWSETEFLVKAAELVNQADTHGDLERFVDSEIRQNFAPKKLVDSAQAFDDSDWLNLLDLWPGGSPDFVETPDGGVVMPGSRKMMVFNLTDLAKGK